jgi:hypothetical protein
MTIQEMKDKMLEIPIGQIVQTEWDVRRYPEDEEKLDALAKSIQADGLLNPLTVLKNDVGNYTLVAGRRRLKACIKLGMKSVPAFIKADKDKQENWQTDAVTVIENLHRRELNNAERAYGIMRIYQIAGFTRLQAIQGTKYLHNERVKAAKEIKDKEIAKWEGKQLDTQLTSHDSINTSTFKSEFTFKPDDKFRKVCATVGYSAVRQYQLLQLATDITEKNLEKTEKKGLSMQKQTLLTNSTLREHPQVVKQLIDEIADKPMDQARARVNQVVHDIRTGTIEKEGNDYKVYDHLREKVDNKTVPEPHRYYLPILGAYLKIMYPLTGRPLTRGEFEYSPEMIKHAREHQINLIKSVDHRELLALNNNLISLNETVTQILDIIDQEFESREKKEEMLKK